MAQKRGTKRVFIILTDLYNLKLNDEHILALSHSLFITDSCVSNIYVAMERCSLQTLYLISRNTDVIISSQVNQFSICLHL